jgi:polar amino acid transport system substrate-binding protein
MNKFPKLCFVIALAAAWSTISLPVVAQSMLDRARTGGINAVVSNDPPFANLQPNGQLTGPVPEIVESTFKLVGVTTIRPVTSDWASMVPGIQSGRFDTTGVGLYMNARRCEALAFSEPVFCDKLTFVVKAGNPKGLNSIADLAKDSSVKIAGERGTAQERTMIDAGVKPEQFVAGSDPLTIIRLVQTGRADVVAIGALQVKGYLAKVSDPTLQIVAIGDSRLQCAGVAFRKEDLALRDAFDTALGGLKSSGEYSKIMQKYELDPELALSSKREMFCPAGG